MSSKLPCPLCGQSQSVGDLLKQEEIRCGDCSGLLTAHFSWAKYLSQVVLASVLASVVTLVSLKMLGNSDGSLVPTSAAIGAIAAVTINKHRFYRLEAPGDE